MSTETPAPSAAELQTAKNYLRTLGLDVQIKGRHLVVHTRYHHHDDEKQILERNAPSFPGYMTACGFPNWDIIRVVDGDDASARYPPLYAGQERYVFIKWRQDPNQE